MPKRRARKHDGAQQTVAQSQDTQQAPTGAMPVQIGARRGITKTSKDVAAVRSRTGKLKGAVTRDRLDEIAVLLDKYHKAAGDPDRLPIVTKLRDVCEEYLFDHTGPKDQAYKGEDQKVALVEDIFAEARLEISRSDAQQAYLYDAYGKERDVRADDGDGDGTTKSTKFKLKHQTAASTARGSTERSMTNVHDAGNSLIKQHGLSEAEVLAIKTFTLADYRYINAATANSKERMEERTPDKAKQKELVEEGTLHTGVAMQGLAKLPPKQGTVYRGVLLTPTDFAKEYVVGNTVTFPSLTSSSLKRAEADNWAGYNDEKKTVHYVATVIAKNARDIMPISTIKSEEEWVLLPGSQFMVRKVEKVDKPMAPGHVWYEVELLQIK